MAEGGIPYTPEAYAQHMDERKGLIDAARESSRTFDQAVLAFGAAVFGASVAFLKDVAPKPQGYTIKWLAISWAGFIFGLLAVALSFLFSHKACLFRIEESEHQLINPNAPPLTNRWAGYTEWCNRLCLTLLFGGVVAWSVFALENLANPGGKNERPANATIGHSQEGLRSAEDCTTTAAKPVNAATTAAKEVR